MLYIIRVSISADGRYKRRSKNMKTPNIIYLNVATICHVTYSIK